MLKKLTIENFKSWEKVDLSLGSVTGLFGTNSSGKTSLIQFLLMLKQTKNNTDRSLDLDFGGESSFADLGHFENAVHGHDTNQAISWSISWKLSEKISIADPEGKRTSKLFEGEEIELKSVVKQRKGAPFTSSITYNFAGMDFSLLSKASSETVFDLQPDKPMGIKRFRFIRTQGRVWELPGPIKSYAFPDQAKTYFQNSGFLSEYENAYENLMDSIYYLGPLREYPRRQYSWAGSRPVDVGRRGEKVIDAILASRSQKEKQNLKPRGKRLPFDGIIAHWLKELGLIHEFKIKEIAKGSNLYETKVRRTSLSPETSIMDVGFGVSQVLPVLVLLHYVPEGSTVLLEQPEIHLHPAVQSGLADVIIHAATYRKVQVIVESHSEHLLRRLQLRVAEEKIDADNTKLYFCDYPTSKSTIEPLNLNMFGEIENWPENFFGDDFGEIAAIRKAGLEKKVAQGL